MAKRKKVVPVTKLASGRKRTAESPPPRKKKATKKQPAPRKKKGVVLDAATVRRATGKLLKSTLNIAMKKYQDPTICAAGEAMQFLVGIPLPSLALEYLLELETFPLGRVIQVIGPEGTMKSSLCWEFVRLFRLFSGLGYLFENESKYSPEAALAIIGYPEDEDDEALGVIPCGQVEHWQSRIMDVTEEVQAAMIEKGGIGCTFPVLLILDSLMGKLTYETSTRIHKTGYSGRAHPAEALAITGFLRNYPTNIACWPMTLMIVNHLKEAKNEQGIVEKKRPGGKHVSFQETIELEMRLAKQSKIELVNPAGFAINGKRIMIRCNKNGLGTTGHAIEVEIKWITVKDAKSGKMRQKTSWDWHKATTKLLLRFSGHQRDKIQEIVDIHGTGDKLWSRKLKVPKEHPVSMHKIGKLIDEHPTIRQQLRELMGIHSSKKFQPGVEYADQLEIAQKSARMKIARRIVTGQGRKARSAKRSDG